MKTYRLYVTVDDIEASFNRAKLHLSDGEIEQAEHIKDQFKKYWNLLNAGMVDVEDVDLLYDTLRALVRRIDEAKGHQYFMSRL